MATDLTVLAQLDLLQAEMQRLKAENDTLKASAKPKLSLKVSEKGAISLYGMGRFPVTLYAAQWEAVLSHGDQIKHFIETHAESLSRK